MALLVASKTTLKTFTDLGLRLTRGEKEAGLMLNCNQVSLGLLDDFKKAIPCQS